MSALIIAYWRLQLSLGTNHHYNLTELADFVRKESMSLIQNETLARTHRDLRKRKLINYRSLGKGWFKALLIGESRQEEDQRQSVMHLV
jgi:hypothetical protein